MRINKIQLFFTILFAFLCVTASAQPSTDEQLAEQYFSNKEFDKAVVYYEKLFNKNPDGKIYKNYISCLLQLKEFKTAEKIVKKLAKNNPQNPVFLVDLGVVYVAVDEPEKAKAEFEKAIKQLPAAQEQIINLANTFMSIKEWDYAIATYQRGRKLVGNIYPFNIELAEVYEKKGDLVSMVNEYLDLLEVSEGFLSSVQSALQNSTSDETNEKRNEVLKTQLLKRVQQSSDKAIYAEMLAWIFIQQKEFEAALTQVKALDKRNKEDGVRVMNLAQTCVSNQNYDVAVKAYKYIVEKGSTSYYYVNARMEMLDAMYKKITAQNNYTQVELVELENDYIETLNELGKTASTVPLIKGLAHLQAFYLHKTNDAIKFLEEAVETPQLSAQTQAMCKLELGDILLMSGDIWEASLKYSQVEKAFKYDQIGHEAKYKNAKVSFYNGDFKWSQAQLDVLKGSTSKLIANDAMSLSMLISDAIGIDSLNEPLWKYSRADLLEFQNKDDKALSTLDSILTEYPTNTLNDDVYLKKYKIMFKQHKYEDAAMYLQKIIENYSFDVLADDAVFFLAQLNENKLSNSKKAMELYQEVITKYPGSLYTVEARKRFRILRGDQME